MMKFTIAIDLDAVGLYEPCLQCHDYYPIEHLDICKRCLLGPEMMATQDMLEALKSVLHPTDATWLTTANYNKVKAAIAKATGETDVD